jgi:phosphinothricin acetyltransferase
MLERRPLRGDGFVARTPAATSAATPAGASAETSAETSAGISAETVRILPMTFLHGPEVLRILGEGMATGHATFETSVPPWDAWDAGHLVAPRWVAKGPVEDPEKGDPGSAVAGDAGLADAVLGWAALSPVSARTVYAGVAEVSVYVAVDARGRGVGRALLLALVEASEELGIWTLQAGVFPENEASLRLHRAHGFREVGRRKRIGRLRGTWHDVLLLERRSLVVGRDA